MASVCISDCINDTCLPIRPTFVNLYKWPESEVEFVKTVNSNNSTSPHVNPRGVDGLTCRQMYLRSYKFSRKKVGVTEKTIKCLSRIKESVVCASNRLNLKCKFKILGRAKDVTCAVVSIFDKLRSHHEF